MRLFRPLQFIFSRNFQVPLTYKLRSLNFNNINTLSTAVRSSKTKINNRESIELKDKLITSLNFKRIEESLPFYSLPIKTLIHLNKITKNDEAKGYCRNRLYYLSSKLQIPPAEISKQLVKRIFVYELSFDWLQKSLDALLSMGVSSDRILRDLWVLKYHHLTITERLQNVKDMDIDTLYPWMVRCSPQILNRYVTISRETRNILGEDKSPQIYLAKRLNTSLEKVEEMCLKLPALKTIRVTKIKNFLDFLIEEGFTVSDIVDKPRVLASSQKTIKDRIAALRKLGFNQPNLNILCRSRKEFQKYIETVETVVNSPSSPTKKT